MNIYYSTNRRTHGTDDCLSGNLLNLLIILPAISKDTAYELRRLHFLKENCNFFQMTLKSNPKRLNYSNRLFLYKLFLFLCIQRVFFASTNQCLFRNLLSRSKMSVVSADTKSITSITVELTQPILLADLCEQVNTTPAELAAEVAEIQRTRDTGKRRDKLTKCAREFCNSIGKIDATEGDHSNSK